MNVGISLSDSVICQAASVAVFSLGLMGDLIGLEKTYIVSLFFAIGTIPAAIFLPRFVSR